MRVVKIVPGSGGTFYCENCLRDLALIKALRRAGADILMVPLYLPMYSDDAAFAQDAPVFFGGINVYLQQHIPFFRRTPRWLDRLFDSRALLRLAARQEGSTRASGMGAMTLSMIRGEDGNQAKELERLVAWLLESGKPDVVHLSSVMLIGLARRLREALDVPVVCSLQDEDVWIDRLDRPYGDLCWQAMGERAAAVDRFIAVSEYYRGLMLQRMHLDPSRVRTVRIGIDLEGYRRSSLPDAPPVIGYLSKLAPSLGLGVLADALIELRRRPGLGHVRMRAMGGLVGGDRRYVRGLQAKLAASGCGDAAEFLPEVDRDSRIRFLEGTTVLSVPMPGGEAFGMFLVEAWAAGVPVVQPRAGGFPELVGRTGGGVLYEAGDLPALVAALESLLRSPARVRELGEAGYEAVHREYGLDRMAAETLGVYEDAVARNRRPDGA
jgi:glycosyltransferase involved in cell wall biosynthesis